MPNSVIEEINLDKINQESLQKVVRITSVAENENEDLVEVVLNVAAAMNVTLRREDIVRVYRSVQRPSAHHDDVSADMDNGRHPRSIVAELRTLDSKIRMLFNKNKLQNTSDFEKLYVKGELTYIRWKLYYYLRELNITI